MSWDENVLKAAHQHSIYNRDDVLKSETCGCFHCRTSYETAEIVDWTDENNATALCPRCGIDSVIGSKSGFLVESADFLRAMHAYWFERTVYVEY